MACQQQTKALKAACEQLSQQVSKSGGQSRTRTNLLRNLSVNNHSFAGDPCHTSAQIAEMADVTKYEMKASKTEGESEIENIKNDFTENLERIKANVDNSDDPTGCQGQIDQVSQCFGALEIVAKSAVADASQMVNLSKTNVSKVFTSLCLG